MTIGRFIVFLAFVGSLSYFQLPEPFIYKIDEVSDQKLMNIVPMELEGWQGKTVPLDEETYRILETRNVVSRIYTSAEGKEVHLLIVGSNKDRRVAHPPEVCYTSSNFEISRHSERTVQFEQESLPVKEFVAFNRKNAERKEKVLYVYKVGDKYTSNYYAQQLQFALDRLTRGESQVLLIRLAAFPDVAVDDFLKKVLKQLS